MNQSDCNSGGVLVSPDLGVSMIRAHVCPATGVSGRSAGSSRDGLEGGGTRGPDLPDDDRSVSPKYVVPLEDRVRDVEDADEEAQVRLRQVAAGQVLRYILMFRKRWFPMKKPWIESDKETSHVHRVSEK